ncbi:MAG: STAS domain-containing protein [Pelosinus sp.]|nr:STAS domain-containing protein [Pelosinus sp.]
MKVNFTLIDNKVVIKLEGSLFVEDALLLRTKALAYFAEGHKNFLIDLSKVDYIDSSGLGVLVSLQKRALEHQGALQLHGLTGVVLELFELTRLNKIFEIV